MKIILTEADYGYGNCDSCGFSGEVKVQVYDSFAELLNHPEVRASLIRNGWVPLQEIKDQQDKLVLENKLYVAYPSHISEFKQAGLENSQINWLANGQAIMVQKVDYKSVLPEKERKRVEEGLKRIKSLEKARVEAKKIRAEKSAQRKLEKAKKLVEQHKKTIEILEAQQKGKQQG